MSQKPKAFFSCSLNREDYQFNSLVESIIRKFDFDPCGTSCKYTYTPQPIQISMREEINKSDCIIIAASPRYLQRNIFNQNTTFGISEAIHVEAGMAFMKDIPILIFKAPNVDIGNFLPTVTQFIEPILYGNSFGYSLETIENYFSNTRRIIQKKQKTQSNDRLIEGIKIGLGILGGLTVINFLADNDEKN